MTATDEALAELLGKYIQAHEKLCYSVPNAARKVDVSTRKMWRMVAEGKVKSIKIVGSRRITAKELARLASEEGG